MEIEKSKISIQFLLIFRRSVDVLFFLYARRLRGYTATLPLFCEGTFPWLFFFSVSDALCSSIIVPHRIANVESSQDDQLPVIFRIVNEGLCSIMKANKFTKSTLSSGGAHT